MPRCGGLAVCATLVPSRCAWCTPPAASFGALAVLPEGPIGPVVQLLSWLRGRRLLMQGLVISDRFTASPPDFPWVRLTPCA